MTSEFFMDMLRDINARESTGGDSELDYSFTHGQMTKNGFKPYRHYTASILLYPQNDDHLKVIENVLSKNYNYAIILHDHDLKDNKNSCSAEDEDEEDFLDVENTIDNDDNTISFKKKHCHLITHHADTRTNTAIAKELKISSRYVRVYSKLSSSLLYLIHRDYQQKYQYSLDCVVGPLACKLGCLDALYARDEADILKEILQKIANVPHDQIIDIAKFSIDLLDKHYHPHVQQKYFYLINNCINQHNRWAGEYKQNI